jgi:hypothetical protein
VACALGGETGEDGNTSRGRSITRFGLILRRYQPICGTRRRCRDQDESGRERNQAETPPSSEQLPLCVGIRHIDLAMLTLAGANSITTPVPQRRTIWGKEKKICEAKRREL